MLIINLEKAYDKVLTDLTLWVLNKMIVPRGYIEFIKDMYGGVVTSVRTTCKETSEFPMTILLHQELTLSPYLFTLIMEVNCSYSR